MYTFESRIRYSETDEQQRLAIPTLVDYFQDCSTFQSEDIGAGLDYMERMHMVWVLASWQVEIKRLPRLGERVVIGTVPYAFKAFLGSRNFCMKSEDGEVLSVANSLWSLLSTDTGKPVNAPQEMMDKYPLGERLDMDYANRKINLEDERVAQEPFVVEQVYVDANHHVNNGKFIGIAAKYLPEGFETKHLRAEYKKQAFLGDVLHPYVHTDGDTCVISMETEDRKPYVVVEFRK